MRTDEMAILTDPAALSHRGWLSLRLDPVTAADLERGISTIFADEGLPDGPGMAVAALRSSLALRAFLDRDRLKDLLTEDLGLASPLLSRCDAIRGPTHWCRSFDRIRRTAPGRRFRPGIDILLPTGASRESISVIECGHLLPADYTLSENALSICDLPFGGGEGVILEAGMPWRLKTPQEIIRITLVRGWIKPDCLHSAALGPSVFSSMGPNARALCGEGVGFPTSIEDFLAIECAALGGSQGRAKGSGI